MGHRRTLKVLVTGANGLLGREAVRQLRQAGHEALGDYLREAEDGLGHQVC